VSGSGPDVGVAQHHAGGSKEPLLTDRRKLTPDELASYHEQGFVIVPDVFPRAECAAIDAEIERLTGELAAEDGHDARHGILLQLGLRSDVTRRICQDERLLALVEDLVHPGIAIYSAKMVPKVPGHSRVCHWHQDDTYYHQKSKAQTRLSVWLALHDSDADNGGVHFLPGSHRWGQQPWEKREEGWCNLAIRDISEEQKRRAVCPRVPAGAVVVFDSLTWHSSDINRCDRIRRSFIVSYQEATAAGGNGEQWTILRPAPRPSDPVAGSNEDRVKTEAIGSG